MKRIVRSVLFLLLVFSFFAFADGRECDNYCRDGIAYSGGTFNERSGSCDYSSRTTCEFGCSSDAIGCAEVAGFSPQLFT